jgi:SAM-dependent methyltransferase
MAMSARDILVHTAAAALRRLPPHWRERLKKFAGALGHEPGWAQRFRARRLAGSTKRLDRLAPEIASLLHGGGITRLTGASCLEFGSGHLLAEPLIYHIAGARRVVAVDYFPIIQERDLGLVRQGAEIEALVSALASFDDPTAVRRRAEAMLARTDWSLDSLRELGISYVAPYDASAGPLEVDAFDLIASVSVLEHVPAAEAQTILQTLFAMLAPNGTMVHAIHLEDHRDFERTPLAFLAADSDWREEDHDQRGNRLRASDWLRLAEKLPSALLTGVHKSIRADVSLPASIDPKFSTYDREDLRVGGLVLGLRRLPTAGSA